MDATVDIAQFWGDMSCLLTCLLLFLHPCRILHRTLFLAPRFFWRQNMMSNYVNSLPPPPNKSTIMEHTFPLCCMPCINAGKDCISTQGRHACDDCIGSATHCFFSPPFNARPTPSGINKIRLSCDACYNVHQKCVLENESSRCNRCIKNGIACCKFSPSTQGARNDLTKRQKTHASGDVDAAGLESIAKHDVAQILHLFPVVAAGSESISKLPHLSRRNAEKILHLS